MILDHPLALLASTHSQSLWSLLHTTSTCLWHLPPASWGFPCPRYFSKFEKLLFLAHLNIHTLDYSLATSMPVQGLYYVLLDRTNLSVVSFLHCHHSMMQY